MRYSDRSPLESDGFNCPSCGNAVQFGEDSAKLEHVDGTPMCTPGEEPPEVRPAALWAVADIAPPTVPGPVEAAAQRSQERAARLEVAHSRHAELEPYGTGKRGGIGWGTVALFLVLALLVLGCFWFVVANWPQS